MLFELPEFLNAENYPLTIDMEVTASLDKKATLYSLLKSWRGRSFADNETDDFNLKEFALGREANVQVIHKNGSGDKAKNVYANINNLFPLGRGQQVPPQAHASLYFDFDDGVAEIPEGTPERIAKKIADSPEWKALQGGGKPVASPNRKSNAGQQAPAEIIDTLNEFGIAYPYDQEELDVKAKQHDMSQAAYEILLKHATPF